MDLVASIFLIAGTVKNRRLLLIPWLIERATSILITAFLLLFYGLFLLFASTKTVLLGIFLLFLGFGVVGEYNTTYHQFYNLITSKSLSLYLSCYGILLAEHIFFIRTIQRART